MYIVEIINNGINTTIHGEEQKLHSGSVVKGINSIDSFTFSMLPSNDGINKIKDFQTLVTVYNTNQKRYEFLGRAIYSDVSMDESGLITKEVTCESYLGYLCDTQQSYVKEKNWTVKGLLKHIIDEHNSQIEEHKRFVIGEVTVTDPNDNLYIGIQRENSWKVITEKLVGTLGGEIRFRTEGGTMYLDYLEEIGETKTTEIALSHNMQSIRRSNDPTAYITRLVPLGCKLKNENDEETEERLDISDVNNGKNYIDDEEAIAEYGVKVEYVYFDDVTVAENLLDKGREYLAENNKVQVKYSIKALDLSLLGLDIDDFEVHDYYPIKNSLLGIDDVARIIKKKIDVCEEIKSTIEVGDNFKTLSDIQREQSEQIQSTLQSVTTLEQTASNLVKVNEEQIAKITELEETFKSEIEQLPTKIKLSVSGSLGSEATIKLSVGTTDQTGSLDLSQIRAAFANDNTSVSISGGVVTFNAGTLVINSTNFSVTSTGTITATSGTIGAITLSTTGIYSNNSSYSSSFAGWYRPTTITTSAICFFAGATDRYGTDAKFKVTYGGKLTAAGAEITGTLITESGLYQSRLTSGRLRMIYDSNTIGEFSSTYYGGDESARGLAIQTMDTATFTLFSHISTDGTYYDPDYIINYGLNPNGITARHIFFDDVYCQGAITARSVYADAIYCPDDAVQFGANTQITHVKGSSVYLGTNDHITYLRGSTVYLKDTNTTVTSDRNAKNSIETLPDEYEIFIDALEPVRFKYNEGTSGRYHVGYIAQDVKDALDTAGLSTMDFAGYVDVEGTGELGLAYDEFIAILHKKIKRLETQIAELQK